MEGVLSSPSPTDSSAPVICREHSSAGKASQQTENKTAPVAHSELTLLIMIRSVGSISVLSRSFLIAAGTDCTPISAFYSFGSLKLHFHRLAERLMRSELELIFGSLCSRLWGSLERLAAVESCSGAPAYNKRKTVINHCPPLSHR